MVDNIKQTIITLKPNSFEFGRAGNRFKLYFEDAKDLQNQIQALKDLKLYQEDFIKIEGKNE